MTAGTFLFQHRIGDHWLVGQRIRARDVLRRTSFALSLWTSVLCSLDTEVTDNTTRRT